VADHPAARPRPATVPGQVVEPGPMARVGNDDVTGQYGTGESGSGDHGTSDHGTDGYGTDDYGDDYGTGDQRMARGA
jgi:hypothetical protein